MRILVLGGTVFLGRHVVGEAIAAGHEVTVFSRGLHGAAPPEGVAWVKGDRTRPDDLARVEGEFDVVVDTCGFEPGDVALSAAALSGRAGRYAFVSSVNAYPGWPEEVVDESSPVWEERRDEYGPKKVLCERAAQDAMPGRVAVLRVGLLCGPWDNIFRVPWWVKRAREPRTLLVPGTPERPIQLVDARDVARFALAVDEPGAFNVTAPRGAQTWGDFVDALAPRGGVEWVDDEVLTSAGVEPWTELPLWIPGGPGTWTVGTDRAQAAGMACRPLGETIADVASWLEAGGEAALDPWRAELRPAGLDEAREAEILRALSSGQRT